MNKSTKSPQIIKQKDKYGWKYSVPLSDQEIKRNHQIFKEIKSRPFVGFPRSFLQLLDYNVNAALLLNQICYWSEINRRNIFYKRKSDWYYEIGLTIRQVDPCLKLLKHKGLVSTERHKVHGPVILFYEVDWIRIGSLVFEQEECEALNENYASDHNNMSQSDIDNLLISEISKKSDSLNGSKCRDPYYSSEVNYSRLSVTKENLKQNLSNNSTNTNLATIALNEKGYPSDWDDLGQITKNSPSH